MTNFKETAIQQAQDHADGWSDRYDPFWFQQYNDKLISLIAAECIESINNAMDDKCYNHDELVGCQYAISAIEEKFPADN